MISILANYETLSHTAAEMFVAQAQWAVSKDNYFSIAFSGGSTPQRMYELLAQKDIRDRVPWENTFVFWGDERCVPPDHPSSNQLMLRQLLLDHVNIPKQNIFPISGTLPPEKAAQEYEVTLRKFFTNKRPGFDLILLGLGENGHTASLFPGTLALDETQRWVTDIYVDELKMHRITLTARFINRAEKIVFLVSGASKALVLKEVCEGPPDPHRLPAQLIKPSEGELVWLVDQEAGSLLTYSNQVSHR
jgi:6-phosphogluconolactonase